MKSSSMCGPPNSPGGSEMLWMTRSEMRSPSGRSSKWGEALVDAQSVKPVSQRAEGNAQQLGGGGLVEARGLERLHDDLALDLVQELVQRQAAGADGAVERDGPVL